jgi:hypothetical protein
VDEPRLKKLPCAECGKEAPPDARGWRADIADDLRDDDPAFVVVFCPTCWEREFTTGDPPEGDSPHE